VAETKRRSGSKKKAGESVCDPLSHPERVRILEVINEAPKSPIRFLAGGYSTRKFKDKQEGLSYISYHFRELDKAGLIEVIESIPRRGAVEHVYSGRSRVFYTNEEFDRLPLKERQMLSRTSFQGLVARTDSAISTGTFDSRTNRQLTYRAMHLDEQGWQEMADHLDEAFAKAEAIREAAAERIRERNGEVIPATVAFLGYESPPLPPID
jgi:hypothetical protein